MYVIEWVIVWGKMKVMNTHRPVTNYLVPHIRCLGRELRSGTIRWQRETNTPDDDPDKVSTIRISFAPVCVFIKVIIRRDLAMNNDKVSEKGVDSFAAYIGIDWADKKHAVWLRDRRTGRVTTQDLTQSPEALTEWVQSLQVCYPGQKMAVGLEQARGALIYALMEYDCLVLYPINPKSLARYREAFAPSGTKDDPSDAGLLGEIVEKHRDKLKAWNPDDELTRRLVLLNEGRRKAVDQRTRLVQQLGAVLKGYFPLALELVGRELDSPMACDFLSKWTTLADLQVVKPHTLRKFFYAHNCRSETLLDERCQRIRQAQPLTRDGAIIGTSVLAVKTVVRQLRALTEAIREYDQEVARCFAAHPDAFIFDSFPGAGTALGPRLVAAFGTDRKRYERATEIQSYSGIAPVIERSGKQCWTHWRWACPTFMRQTFHEFAKCSIPRCIWAKAYYQMQIERGKKHHAAIRALAFMWQRIMLRCWQARQPYNEQHYLDSLKKHNNDLWHRVCALSQAA
jgi:transposase